MTRLLLPDRATGYALAGTGGTVGVYRGRILVPSATGRHRCAPQASPSRAMIRPRRRQARRPRPPPQAHPRYRTLSAVAAARPAQSHPRQDRATKAARTATVAQGLRPTARLDPPETRAVKPYAGPPMTHGSHNRTPLLILRVVAGKLMVPPRAVERAAQNYRRSPLGTAGPAGVRTEGK